MCQSRDDEHGQHPSYEHPYADVSDMVQAVSRRCCGVIDVIDEPVDIVGNALIVLDISIISVTCDLPHVEANGGDFEKLPANRAH